MISQNLILPWFKKNYSQQFTSFAKRMESKGEENDILGSMFEEIGETPTKPIQIKQQETKLVDSEAEFSKFLEKVETEITCPVCYSCDEELHQLSPCLHQYCKNCVEATFRGPNRLAKCPLCHAPFTAISKSHALTSIKDLVLSKKTTTTTNTSNENVILVVADGSEFIVTEKELVRNRKLVFYLMKIFKKPTINELLEETDRVLVTKLSPIMVHSMIFGEDNLTKEALSKLETQFKSITPKLDDLVETLTKKIRVINSDQTSTIQSALNDITSSIKSIKSTVTYTNTTSVYPKFNNQVRTRRLNDE